MGLFIDMLYRFNFIDLFLGLAKLEKQTPQFACKQTAS